MALFFVTPSVQVNEKERKDCINSRAMEVQEPDAHAKPLGPQLFLSGANMSAGQEEEFPVQNSVVSQIAFLEARQACVAGAN